MVKLDLEAGEVVLVLRIGFRNKGLFGDAPFPGALHDRGAVCIIRTEVDAAMAAQLLETDPDVGLDVLHQMADVNRSIGVGECRSDEYPSLAHAGSAVHRLGTKTRSGIVVLKQLGQEWVQIGHGSSSPDAGSYRDSEPKCNQNETRGHVKLPMKTRAVWKGRF